VSISVPPAVPEVRGGDVSSVPVNNRPAALFPYHILLPYPGRVSVSLVTIGRELINYERQKNLKELDNMNKAEYNVYLLSDEAFPRSAI
jgi:hypothetical protein